MIRLVIGESQRVAAWAAAKIGVSKFTPPLQAIGFEKNGALVGAGVFNIMTEFNIFTHLAGAAALQRGPLRAMWNYVFEQLGKLRTTAIVASNNEPMLRVMPRLGWRPEGRLQDYYGQGVDLIVFGMWREDAPKWMRTDQHG